MSVSSAMNSGCGSSAASAPSAAAPPKVTVQRFEQRELVDFDEYSGWLQASETVEVRSRVRGHIQKVHFTDGQIVEEGQLLFELDPRPFQAEIDRATEQANISLAQRERAGKEEARYTELLNKGASTQSQVDEMVAATKSFAAQYLSALEEIKRRKLDLEYSKITAPIGGRISRAYLTAGNLVNAGGSDPLLTTIVKINPIQIYIYVDERSLQNYRAGRSKADPDVAKKPLKEAQIPIEFGRDIDNGYPHKGILDFAENRIDSGTGTIQVRAEVKNDDALFIPGERVKVRIPISEKYQALLVPETAILTDQDKKYVLCLNDQNIVFRRNITSGRLLDDGMRVILGSDKDEEPLSTKDQVIVLGLQRARVNYPAEPVDAEGNAVTSAGK
ncbi:MAG: efflux RND transporter periplasmic adaptor subunit [Planctomycetaceae bacterium]